MLTPVWCELVTLNLNCLNVVLSAVRIFFVSSLLKYAMMISLKGCQSMCLTHYDQIIADRSEMSSDFLRNFKKILDLGLDFSDPITQLKVEDLV